MDSEGTFIDRLNRFDANFIIGVAGDSGSGKTTFTKAIRGLIGNDLISSFSLDDYHTQDRAERKISGKLALDPEINNLELLAEHLEELKMGKPIIKPVYDHSTGKFAPSELFEPKTFVVAEGLHTFYTEALRKSIDFSIFVDPVREVKWRWKIKRDVDERGHSKDDVINSIRKREPLFKKYIDHQKIYADVVVKIHPSRFEPVEGVAVELVQAVPEIPLSAINLDLDVSGMLRGSEKNLNLEFSGSYYYGKPVSRIRIDGHVRRQTVENLIRVIQDFTGIHEEHRLFVEGEYVDAVGIAQLLICWRFLEKMDFLLKDLEKIIH
jgi:phosphoribulokinase